jgi:hypothetical protein
MQNGLMSARRNQGSVSVVKGKFSAYMSSAKGRNSVASPNGHRQNHFYQSPQHKVNESFNFWHDIKTNVVKRSNWEDKGTSGLFTPPPPDTNRSVSNNRRGLDSSATRVLMTDRPEQGQMVDERRSAMKDKAKYISMKQAARGIISKIDLTTDPIDIETKQEKNSKSMVKKSAILYPKSNFHSQKKSMYMTMKSA